MSWLGLERKERESGLEVKEDGGMLRAGQGSGVKDQH